MEVADVQQQTGGNDCGVFSIAYATLLCMGEDPTGVKYNQKAMREELIKAFETRDLKRFIQETTEARKGPISEPKFEWRLRVYCYCRMPDDGMMVQCTSCKSWFHKSCLAKSEDTTGSWLCINCKEKKNEEQRRKEEEEKWKREEDKWKREYEEELERLRLTTTTHLESYVVQSLYDSINYVFPDFDFGKGQDHIGCMTPEEYRKLYPKFKKQIHGICHTCMQLTPKFFIVIMNDV